MGYDISDKVEWTVIFILEFGRRFGLTMKQAFGYLSRYKAIDYIDRHYGYVHTQSFASVIDDMAEFCRRKGGSTIENLERINHASVVKQAKEMGVSTEGSTLDILERINRKVLEKYLK